MVVSQSVKPDKYDRSNGMENPTNECSEENPVRNAGFPTRVEFTIIIMGLRGIGSRMEPESRLARYIGHEQ
jgi:hypothetical protein